MTQLTIDLFAEGYQRKLSEVHTAGDLASNVDSFVGGQQLSCELSVAASWVDLTAGAGGGIEPGSVGAGAVGGGHTSPDCAVRARRVSLCNIVAMSFGAWEDVVNTVSVASARARVAGLTN